MRVTLRAVKKFTDKEFQANWDRQRATAAHIVARFEQGYDTQLLGDEVGMGKTYVALAAIADELTRGQDGNRVLLITPSSAVLRAKWEQEVRSFSSKYLSKAGRPLHPLVINSYWDLVAALHDHPNLSRKNVTEERLRCLLEVTWDWFAGRKKLSGSRPKARWTVLERHRPKEFELSNFLTQFSIPAWNAFLEAWNGSRNGDLVKQLGREAGMWDSAPAPQLNLLKKLFREFAEHQDDYEPNVLIVGMRALTKPRSNSAETQRFVTYLLAALLSGRWEQTRRDTLRRLQPTGLLLSHTTVGKLEEFGTLDLFRTRECVDCVMEHSPGLAKEWQNIIDGDKSTAGSFFASLTKAVVTQKLGEANIRLAVVDEVHNWKSNTNGAAEFKADFSPRLARKLIMSATPFQLDEGELPAVFGSVANPSGKSAKAVASLYQGAPSIVDRCVAANQRFMQTWDEVALNKSDLDRVSKALREATTVEDAVRCLLIDPQATHTIRLFCKAAQDYRAAVIDLSDVQNSIVVRHLKRNPKRSFHAGVDFSTQTRTPRQVLYETPGLSRFGNELVSLLAMRVDQLIRTETGASESVKAHLMSGMTSSFSAFKSGIQGRAWKKAQLTLETRRYIEMLESVMSHTPHEKVQATVEHAFANYQEGRKTLVFCERRDTVDEIQQMLALRIGGNAPVADIPVHELRDRVLGAPLFVDLPFFRFVPGNDEMSASKRKALVDRTVAMLRCVPVRLKDAAGKRRILRLFNIVAIADAGQPLDAAVRLCEVAEELFRHPGYADQLRRDLLNDRSEQIAVVDEEIETYVTAVLVEHLSAQNLWITQGADALAEPLLRLIESEAQRVISEVNGAVDPSMALGFIQRLLELETGLKRVLLRNDVLGRAHTSKDEFKDQIHDAVRGSFKFDRTGESAWNRMIRFVSQLAEADGSINMDDMTNTRRKGLWRAVSLRGQRATRSNDAVVGDDDAEKAHLVAAMVADQLLVQSLHGKTGSDARINICAAFNSPLPPEVLVCTAIGSEGIDLHRECSEVIHHDLPWNPARLEQRIGRIDRVGSLSESIGVDVRIGLPFLEISYERFQYGTLLRRAQRFELLLGRPDFDLTEGQLECDDDDHVADPDPHREAAYGEATPRSIPDRLIDWFAVDLAVYRPSS